MQLLNSENQNRLLATSICHLKQDNHISNFINYYWTVIWEMYKNCQFCKGMDKNRAKKKWRTNRLGTYNTRTKCVIKHRAREHKLNYVIKNWVNLGIKIIQQPRYTNMAFQEAMSTCHISRPCQTTQQCRWSHQQAY